MSKEVAPDKIKLSFIFPRYLKTQFDFMAKKKNVSKTSVVIRHVEEWIRDECEKMNIDINEITKDTNIHNPPKMIHSDDEPWF